MFGPGLGIRQSSTGQPVQVVWSTLCQCGCHPTGQVPEATEARLCQECADMRFTPWASVVDVMTR